ARDRPLALAHLTLLGESPPSLVRTAADAGYDGVGLRLRAVHPGEEPWSMPDGSPMLEETRRAMDSSGIEVWDVEVVRVDGDFDPGTLLPLFAAASFLGATNINVFPSDDDRDRLVDSLARLARLANDFNLTILIEPMIYNSVPNLDSCLAVLEKISEPNVGMIVDAMHFHRFGGQPSDISRIPEGALRVFQMCDAPLTLPERFDVSGPLPRNQSLEVDSVALEGRAFRLLPGEGELPLAEMVSQLPPSVPISVEAPCFPLQRELSAIDIARRAHSGAMQVIEAAHELTESA
ncbi:MAG: sugar phosphate isomerase/epimerase family protein, partial [Acidimicrobiales bacterium]